MAPQTKHTNIVSLASGWNRPETGTNVEPGESAEHELNEAAREDDDMGELPGKNIMSVVLKELEHSQALNRQLLKQLTKK